MEKIKVLLDSVRVSENDVTSWVSDINDIITVEVISASCENYNEEYQKANIEILDGINFPIPKNKEYAYVFDEELIGEHSGDGWSYCSNGGFAIAIKDDDVDNMRKLRFRHEYIHHLDMPADAMSYYYCVKVPSMMDTVLYFIKGCNFFSSTEGDPRKSAVRDYQNKYYNALFDMRRKSEVPDWSNEAAPKWLKRS